MSQCDSSTLSRSFKGSRVCKHGCNSAFVAEQIHGCRMRSKEVRVQLVGTSSSRPENSPKFSVEMTCVYKPV